MTEKVTFSQRIGRALEEHTVELNAATHGRLRRALLEEFRAALDAQHERDTESMARLTAERNAAYDENAVLRRALEFYADERGGIWEKCEDDGEQGLFRQYITGTCHPREIARRALAQPSPSES